MLCTHSIEKRTTIILHFFMPLDNAACLFVAHHFVFTIYLTYVNIGNFLLNLEHIRRPNYRLEWCWIFLQISVTTLHNGDQYSLYGYAFILWIFIFFISCVKNYTCYLSLVNFFLQMFSSPPPPFLNCLNGCYLQVNWWCPSDDKIETWWSSWMCNVFFGN